MLESSLLILLIALVLDWYFGEPEILWSRIPHPVIVFGKAVDWSDKRFNVVGDSEDAKYRKGSMSIAALVLVSLVFGFALDFVASLLGLIGWVLEIFLVFFLLSQRSLHDHVGAVGEGLREGGLEGGRKAVGMIVGRDPQQLDHSGVCRAGIESLAENYSDGVIAPAFWYAVFGLPGILAYKMINTADSMIGYKNERYRWFGQTTAQIDDLANWLPARISALLIALGTGVSRGLFAMKRSVTCAFRDSRLHRSPNAGWPEAAMAGALNIALGGPRQYAEDTVSQTFLNSSGKRNLGPEDIDNALNVFAHACLALWAVTLILTAIL